MPSKYITGKQIRNWVMVEAEGFEYDVAINQRLRRAMMLTMTLRKKQEIMEARHQRE